MVIQPSNNFSIFAVHQLERCLSGRKGRFAKPLYPAKGTEGSNPSLSAIGRRSDLRRTKSAKVAKETFTRRSILRRRVFVLEVLKIFRGVVQLAVCPDCDREGRRFECSKN